MKERIRLLDGLRGLAVCLMVLHHLAYDLVVVLGAPAWLFSCPPIDVLHYIFAGLFVLLSGVSSRFSRSNLKRGLRAAALALGISLVTHLLETDILWGVLHLLAFCMLLYGAAVRLWRRAGETRRPGPWRALAALWVPALLLGLWAFSRGESGAARFAAFVLGSHPEYFASADYFPLWPWLPVFLAGTLLGGPIRAGRFPRWFYEARMPFFDAVGRHSLLIYLLHQPVLYGLVLAIRALL